MTDKQALRALIEAVEAAGWGVTDWRNFQDIPAGNSLTPGPILAHRAYQGSLDAAKALHEALLGAERYGYGIGPWGARVWIYSSLPDWDRSVRQEVDLVNNPARAWLIAILKAYEAQQ